MTAQLVRKALDRYIIKQPRLRRALTHIIFGAGERHITLVGLNITVNLLRENGYYRAWRKSRGSIFLEHEIGVLLTLALVVRRCDSFVDAGANIGVFAAAMAKRKLLDPSFEIVAFEPHPDTYKRLVRNVAARDVNTVNAALSSKDGELDFVDGAVSHVFTAAAHKNSYSIPAEISRIPCKRLDSYPLSGQSILLKVDVEGHELEVLEGARALFTSGRIAAVYCDGHDADSVPAFLKNMGFSLFDGVTLEPTLGKSFALLALRGGSRTPESASLPLSAQ